MKRVWKLRRKSGGFSLVELLVVLVILGLTASVVVLTMGPGADSLQNETERLALRLKHAREEAILTNRPISLVFTDEGYRVRTLRRTGWVDLDKPFEPVRLHADTRLSLSGSQARPGDATSAILFDPTGLASPAHLTLIRDRERRDLVVTAQGDVAFAAEEAR
ncbi:MAG: GspH/FimT family protein [Asticcacaulis sp.]